jgi:methionine-gamma-lyase
VAIHAGENMHKNKSPKASAPDICMSTTFTVDKILGFSAANQDSIRDNDSEADFIYTRWGNPTISQLEKKLTALENGAGCLAFASGMAASTAVLLSQLSSGDHVICSDINYPGTAELFRHTLPRFGVHVSCVNTADPSNVANAVKNNTKMIWIETPANPILRLTDISAVSAIASGCGACLVVDSTFATPIATRPLDLGADFVVHSLTKYIGGHGDALGGAVVGKDSLSVAALGTEASVHFGATLSPFNAWLISRGAATLPIRMKAHEENAMAVARWLEGVSSCKRGRGRVRRVLQ